MIVPILNMAANGTNYQVENDAGRGTEFRNYGS